jgi:hypothetical protein
MRVHMMSLAGKVPGAAQILPGYSQTAVTRALLASCRWRASARARSCAGVGLAGVRAAPQVSETAAWADSLGRGSCGFDATSPAMHSRRVAGAEYARKVPTRPEQPRLTMRQRLPSIGDVPYMIVFTAPVVLKLTGVITWSWWWVLTPLWIGTAASALVAGFLFILFMQNRGGPERLYARLRRESLRRLPPGPPEGADLATWIRDHQAPTADT